MRRDSVRRNPVLRRAGAGAVGLALILAVAGCASAPGSDPADTIGNIFAFNSPTAPPVEEQAQPQVTYDVLCPIIDVAEGSAAHRVYAGSGTGSQDVRYQFSIGQTARECSVQDGQLVMRVGVEGRVLLGPSGRPSSFTVPVRIAVRDEQSQNMLDTNVYRVAVTIPEGSAQATFSVVSEPIMVPLRRREANRDYMIFVGFEGGAQAGERRGRGRRG